MYEDLKYLADHSKTKHHNIIITFQKNQGQKPLATTIKKQSKDISDNG